MYNVMGLLNLTITAPFLLDSEQPTADLHFDGCALRRLEAHEVGGCDAWTGSFPRCDDAELVVSRTF